VMSSREQRDARRERILLPHAIRSCECATMIGVRSCTWCAARVVRVCEGGRRGRRLPPARVTAKGCSYVARRVRAASFVAVCAVRAEGGVGEKRGGTVWWRAAG